MKNFPFSTKIFIVTFLIIISVFFSTFQIVYGSQVPEFPLCSNPQGDLKVHYQSGTHGVVGDPNSYQGEDWVYALGSGNFLQCFCGDDGYGIQTDWWKIVDFSQSEIENYRESGWIYVPDGSLWDLDPSPYLARNSIYSCGGKSVPTPTPSQTPTPIPTKTDSWQLGGPPICTATRPKAPVITSIKKSGSKATLSWTKVDLATHYTISYGTDRNNLEFGVPNTGNVTSYTIEDLDPDKTYFFKVYAVNDCMPSEPSSELLTGVSVLGLAATGTLPEIISILSFGLASLTLGFVLRKKD